MRCKNCKNYTFPNASSKSLAMGRCSAYTTIEEYASYLPSKTKCINGRFQQANKETQEALQHIQALHALQMFSVKEGNHYVIVGSEQYNKERVINSLNRLHQKKNIDTIAVSNKKGVAEYAKEWAIDNGINWIEFKLDDKHT